jgi:hypothetical protein
VLSNHTEAAGRKRNKTSRTPDADVLPAANELHVEFGPFPIALGRPVPAQARGWIGRTGYGMAIRGEGEVSHTLRLASLLGLPAVKASVEGTAQMDLQIAGVWKGNVSGLSSGFSLPEVTGTVRLHNVRATVRGLNGPIEISSAELHLARDGTRVSKLNARAADALWAGTVALPRGCGAPGACLIRFDLNTEEIGLSDLYQWLDSQPEQRRWYQMLSSTKPATPSFLENLHASGKVTAAHLLIHDIVASRVSASLDLERGKLRISDVRADLLGGKHRGDWHADFTGGPPVYAGSGTFTGTSLEQVADAMHDPWISGTASGTYQLTASGADSAGFWQSAEGELQFDVHDGILSHISLANDEEPLQVDHWESYARLRHRTIDIEKGTMASPSGAYEISGSASLERLLDLKLTRSADVKAGAPSLVYSVTGTVAEPRITVTPAAETRAELKP